MSQSFRLGQSVYLRHSAQRSAPRGEYRIIRSLPQSGDEREYRIKSALEPYERVAKESELKSA